MNHPPLVSDRTHATGVPPSPEFCILTSEFSPIMQNEPNLRRSGPVEYEKCETNPICRGVFCETNPIPKYQVSNHPLFLQNEPNFSRGGPVEDPNMRNEPNSSIPGVPPTPHLTLTPKV
ncbi:MAG: hypothetical protein J7M40_12120, partial [Planctomycetes bacterium]|nr:hypothetical protein [Planctomycetota bacterium]